ncbi:MAG: TolC family protein [Gammaproteobacteria bacterium]|nr:TolC family protein [Gammaproteobacteria bacterium]
MAKPKHPLRIPLAATGLLALSGCASLTADHGFAEVAETAQARTGYEARWTPDEGARAAVRAEVERLLAPPLDMDSAVRVALLNNPGLQASYAELGIAEADLVQAGRLRNPGFSYAQLSAEGEGGVSIERSVTFDFLGLLTMPVASKIEKKRFAQTKLRVADDIVRVATDARRAFVSAVAAQETARYLANAQEAVAASRELAERMARAGNISQLDLLRERAFYGEVSAELAQARQIALAERENLVRILGLAKQEPMKLSERLPELPKQVDEIRDVEELALTRRFDVAAGKREIESLASSLGLTKATRFVNVLEVGYLSNTNADGPNETGYEITLELPLFDWGSARVAKAEAIYMQAFNRVTELAIHARSEVRETYAAYKSGYDLARYYRDEVVPVRRKIAEENVLRYNGMLIGPFDLLIDARDQIATEIRYVEAVRDFWLAEAALAQAVGGRAGVLNNTPAKAATE